MEIQPLAQAAQASALRPAPSSRGAPPVQDSSGTIGATAAPTPSQAPGAEAVQQAAESIQAAVQTVAEGLRFSVDKDTGQTIVKLVDASTNEVLRQIPSEEALAISKSLDRLQGLLVEQKV